MLDLNEMVLKNSESFFCRLKSCLIVQAKYKESFRNLRDSLGGNQALSSFPSISSSVQNNPAEAAGAAAAASSSVAVNRELQQVGSNLSKKQPAATNLSRRNPSESMRSQGILMSEEEVIFGHLDTFCNRIKCLIDQFTSLAQFQSLFRISSTLSRPKREDLNSIRLSRKDLGDEKGLEDEEEDENGDGDENEDDDLEETSGESRGVNKAAAGNTSSFYNMEDLSKTVSLGILLEENEETIQSRQSLTKNGTKTTKTKDSDLKNENYTTSQINENVSSDSDFDENEQFDDDQQQQQSTEQSEDATTKKSPRNPNPNILFKLESNIESDSKNILKKAQTLSKEDLILMSN
jgi:hypothetical protein